MTTLAALKSAHEAAFERFLASIDQSFPGFTEWHWYRAVEHVNGKGIGRRNDDTTFDEALSNDVAIKDAHDSYIAALHAFYSLRDGPRGVLGGRGF
jgi:hypothetical protein